MENIKRLQKLPINRGLYLVLPNAQRPLFIIPLISKRAFKKAVSLIKPKNNSGNFKKKVLIQTPFFILRRLFKTIELETDVLGDSFSGQLVLPWNQDSKNKFTIFDFEKEQITLLKIGFGQASELIDNEYECIRRISDKATDIIPEIKSYQKFSDHSILGTKFYEGHHPSVMPSGIRVFFENLYKNADKKMLDDHPYIKKIKGVVLNSFASKNPLVIDWVKKFMNKYKDEMIPLVIMHGDCSITNVIKTDNGCRLIDWEEAIIDGAPLDLTYFEFRKKIDNNESWVINSVLDFLVVLHYFYFQIKHHNNDYLERFKFNSKVVNVRQEID